ncbi:MAG: hypothetical protein Q8M77_06890 [Hydrogenophaga sp.]|nr:hypothetical protein [Hydrogenophaga sp.]
MADIKSIKAPISAPITTSPLRLEVARVACFEVQQLAEMLQEYIEKYDSSGQNAPAMRGSLMRLSNLSDIIYEAVITDEPEVGDDELTRRMGVHAVRCEAVHHG